MVFYFHYLFIFIYILFIMSIIQTDLGSPKSFEHFASLDALQTCLGILWGLAPAYPISNASLEIKVFCFQTLLLVSLSVTMQHVAPL